MNASEVCSKQYSVTQYNLSVSYLRFQLPDPSAVVCVSELRDSQTHADVWIESDLYKIHDIKFHETN